MTNPRRKGGNRRDFDELVSHDRQMAAVVEHLSHERAIKNLTAGGTSPHKWAKVASSSIEHLARKESDQIFTEAADSAGLAIVFGNILDTIPGCLVIGPQFVSFKSLSYTLLIGMFLGGIPEAAASGAMLRKAKYRWRKADVGLMTAFDPKRTLEGGS